MAAAKQLLLVHGRGFKPPAGVLLGLWKDAIGHGVRRDRPDAVNAWEACQLNLVYYGDLTQAWLPAQARRQGYDLPAYDVHADVEDRRRSIDRLKTLGRDDFTREAYARMRGHAPIYEAVADVLEYPLAFLKLSGRLIQSYAPELREYWADVHFGSDLRSVCTAALRQAMERPGDIALVSHSLGTLIAYDTCWKLSHYGEYRKAAWNRPVDLFVTLGGPLGNRTIRDRLKGARLDPEFRFPTNLRRWENLTAEDDVIAHDERLADDFSGIRRRTPLRDHEICNPSIRRGSPDPHYSAGYLMHPTFIRLLCDWLTGATAANDSGGA